MTNALEIQNTENSIVKEDINSTIDVVHLRVEVEVEVDCFVLNTMTPPERGVDRGYSWH